METIDQTAKNLLAQLNAHRTITTPSSDTHREALPPHWIARIFSKMQSRYTHMWTSALPSTEITVLAMEDWAEELAGLTAEQIKIGFDKLDEPYPPSPSMFKKLCTGAEDAQHNTAAYRVNFTEQRITRQDRMIESKRDKSKGRQALAEARKIMGGNNE